MNPPIASTASAAGAARLFRASCVALIVTAMSFALRGEAAGAWATEFNLTNEQVGWINGTAFWGFTLAMVFGGPLCDLLGMGRIVGLAFIGHLAGTRDVAPSRKGLVRYESITIRTRWRQ